jgi:glycosyltransferase involved in cell wall biosynthesis
LRFCWLILSTSDKPALCLIHEAISHDSAIAKVALLHARTALDAGWKVSVVAQRLEESIRDRVEWLKLHVPARSFFYKWVTAGKYIRKAIGDRRFDVVHSHQPQAAAIADVFHCHFLTRVAYERKCLEMRSGLRPKMIRLQQQGVLYAEDKCYRGWNPATHMVFCSDLLRREFTRLYGAPPSQEVMVNASPAARFPTAEQRAAARKHWVGDEFRGLVLGYLGGLQERKGYKLLLKALEGKRDVFLLMGGQFTQGFSDPALAGHMKAVGLVDDVPGFIAACDAFVVPSLFDPCPLMVFEAASRGAPVIATDGVGNLHELLTHKAGLQWREGEDLAKLVAQAAMRREEFNAGAAKMAEAISEERQGSRLLEIYDAAMRSKRALLNAV